MADMNRSLAIRESPVDLRNRGLTYIALGDTAHGLADFDRVAQLSPNDYENHNSRCWNRAAAGVELNVALTACDRAVELTASDPSVQANYLDSRGLVNLKLNRNQEAWNDYDRAVRFNPNGAHFTFGRGVAAARLGRADDARADFARALALDANIAGQYASYGVTADAALLPAH
jgi:Flp pilus assembly protein TadD